MDVDEIKRAVANVLEESRNVGQGRVKDATALDNLILSVVKLDVYAMIPKCMTWLVSNKAPEAVVSMLSSTVSARPDDVFEQSSILEATLQTLNSIAKSEKRANTSVRCCCCLISGLWSFYQSSCQCLKKVCRVPRCS